MVAIPLKNSTSTTICESFMNATHFALLDITSGYFKVEENMGCGDKVDTAKCVKDLGAMSTIFYSMGDMTFQQLNDDGIKVYSAKDSILTIEEIYRKMQNSNCEEVNEENYSSLLNLSET